RGIGPGAGAKQKLRRGHVVPPRGPVKSGRAVGLRGIDVDSLLKEGADRVAVRAHDGIRQPHVGAAGSRQTDGRQQEPDPESSTKSLRAHIWQTLFRMVKRPIPTFTTPPAAPV